MTEDEFWRVIDVAVTKGAVPGAAEFNLLQLEYPRSGARGDGFEQYLREGERIAKMRWTYIQKYGYSVPCAEAVELLMRYAPILEVGAGTGTWSAVMAANDIDVICTNPHVKTYSFNPGDVFETENLLAKNARRKYPDRNVFCSWPCYRGDWLNVMLQEMREGQYFIYVGESEGGCTGSDRMFDILKRNFEEVESIYIPQFEGMHDYLTVYRRNQFEPLK